MASIKSVRAGKRSTLTAEQSSNRRLAIDAQLADLAGRAATLNRSKRRNGDSLSAGDCVIVRAAIEHEEAKLRLRVKLLDQAEEISRRETEYTEARMPKALRAYREKCERARRLLATPEAASIRRRMSRNRWPGSVQRYEMPILAAELTLEVSPRQQTRASLDHARQKLSDLRSELGQLEAKDEELRQMLLSRGMDNILPADTTLELTNRSADSAKRSSLNVVADRSASIAAFVSKLADAGHKITRKNIWTVAGYRDRTEFQRFQLGQGGKTGIENFRRVLAMEVQDFILVLKRKTQK